MGFLDRMVRFLPQVKKFLTIIPSNTFSVPFSLCSPSGRLIMDCSISCSVILLLCSLHFLKFFFLFAAPWVSSTALSSRSLIFSSASSSLLLNLSSVFEFTYCIFSSEAFVWHFPVFSPCSSILLPRSGSTLMTTTLNSLSGKLSPFH